MTERAALADPHAIVEAIAADLVAISKERGCVLRGDLLRLGWTAAQIDRHIGAATIVADASLTPVADAPPRPNPILQAAHTARALAGDALEIAALALFVGAILLATPAARVLA